MRTDLILFVPVSRWFKIGGVSSRHADNDIVSISLPGNYSERILAEGTASGNTCRICGQAAAFDQATCSLCGASLAEETPSSTLANGSSSACPGCGAALARDAVLCIECGFDKRKGQRLE